VRVEHLRAGEPVVVGLPRGGVPVASEVATALDAPLDIILVRKLGVPFQPELAMGAIGEDGVRVLDDHVIRSTRVSPSDIATVEVRERAEIERQAQRFRPGRAPVPLVGRTVVVVDDGIATGSSARAACRVARARGAARVVLAVPVAPRRWREVLAAVADELVCVEVPEPFLAVGHAYDDFSQTSDDEVEACLARCAVRPDDRGVRRPGPGSGGSAT
jgi:putative phosphoribosyl transferase